MFAYFKNALLRFRDDTRGVITIEAVITLPLLFLSIMATYEFFEVFRYKSIREKATYTIADLISRETEAPGSIDQTYIDNASRLFDDMTNDRGVNQVRITMVRTDPVTNDYIVRWSELGGTGSLTSLGASDLQGTTILPDITNSRELIMVESQSDYIPLFNIGFGNSIPITTRSFTPLRTLPKLCWEPDLVGGIVCPN